MDHAQFRAHERVQPDVDRIASAVAVQDFAHQALMHTADHLGVGARQFAQRAGGQADVELVAGFGGGIALRGETQFGAHRDRDIARVVERGDGLFELFDLGAPRATRRHGQFGTPAGITAELIGQHLREILITDRSLHRRVSDARAAAAAGRLLELADQRFPGENIQMKADGGDVLSGDARQFLGIERLAGAA